ncbi:ISLre2 family transposase [Streptococcus dysgalactiae]|uniref:ISLre2 family transposase n=1 Tax=Streptococcus dysgalactiae TaxID=1334 RepID=UPI003DA11F24
MRFDEKIFVIEMAKLREKEFLKRIRDYDEQIATTMRQHGYKRVDSSERTVLFTFGEVTISRSRWRKGKKTRYPVDEWLGLKKYMRYSPELLFQLAKLASKMSYREVCRSVRDTYHLSITKDTVLKAVKMAENLFFERERYRFFVEKESPRKLKVQQFCIEGDGVMVKTTSGKDERHNTDLAHFLIHTGSKKVGKGRYILQNKHEIIHTNYDKAMSELLDYLYNHFELTDQTLLVTNSDNGKGYTRRAFQEIKKALGIKHHEHFWDSYHLNDSLKQFFKPYPKLLRDLAFKAIETHRKSLLQTVFDTTESLVTNEEEYERLIAFKQKLFRNFKDTKPAKLRGLASRGIGVMESQHRKVTYRMKHRGMYWSLKGAYAMAKLILLERIDQLENLFFGDWRKRYEEYKGTRLGVGYLVDHYPHGAVIVKH